MKEMLMEVAVLAVGLYVGAMAVKKFPLA